MIPPPYAYPSGSHVRAHGPTGWADYRRYREWVRDDFKFRCVYCLERETWRDMRVAMQLDHFEAQVRAPGLKATYNNLLYLCPACNLLKGEAELPDPCGMSLHECLKIDADGRISASCSDGHRIIEVLELDDDRVVRHRRRIIGTIASHSASGDQVQLGLWLGFPDNLPDLLNIAPAPPGNSLPEGQKNCHFELRRKGLLPSYY